MKKLFLFIAFVLISISLFSEVSKTLNNVAGGLATALTQTEKETITNLTLTGTLDARDFKTMRDFMPLLAALDISASNIVFYSGLDGSYPWGTCTYPENEIPDYAFYNANTSSSKNSLKSIILPTSIIAISQYSFYKCLGLTSISIPLSVKRIEPYAFGGCCFSSPLTISPFVTTIGNYSFSAFNGVIQVDPENPNYASIDSVLFDKKISKLMYCSLLKKGNYTLPATVKTIAGSAFYKCNLLSSITLQDSVTTIESYAFRECSNVVSINLPNSVKDFGWGVFYNCSKLASMTIPEGIRKIEGTFYGCFDLKKLTLPSTLSILGSNTLFNCFLKRLDIPLSVDSIGDVGFSANFDTLTVLWHTPLNLHNRTNALNNINRTRCLLRVPFGLKNIYQNASIWGDFVKIQEMNGIFLSKNDINIDVQGGIKEFTLTSSEEWNATSDQTWLTLSANSGQKGIDTLSVSATPNTTGNFRTATVIFSANGQTSKTLKITQNPIIDLTAGNLNSILKGKLNDFSSLTLSGTIDARDFKTMRDSMPCLREVDLENTTILEYTGNYGTKSSTSFYPANEVPEEAFFKSKIEKVVLPNTTTSIGKYCFFNCFGLNSLNIPEGVTRIKSYSFYGCTKLPAITLSATVTIIDSLAFTGSSPIINIDDENQNFSDIDGVLFNKPQTTLIHCPIVKTETYTIPNTVTLIGNHAFQNCSNLLSIILPQNVRNIGYQSFKLCKTLDSIIIPSSVISIGKSAFSECISLKSVEIPSTVQTIGSHLFYFCDKLDSVIINSPIQELPMYTFYYCESLKSVTINHPLKRIHKRAFGYCTALSSFNFFQSVEYIEEEAFLSCSSLKKVIIPSSTKSIGIRAFKGCSSLTYASINSKVTYLGDYSFQDCNKMDSLYAFPTAPIVLSTASYVFNNVNKTTCKLFVPYGSKSAYQLANQWKEFSQIEEMPGVIISDDTLTIASNGGSDSIFISSNREWSVSSSEPWLTVTRLQGSENDTLVFIAIDNTTISSRTALVTVSGESIESRTITVIQDAGTGSLVPEDYALSDSTVLSGESTCFNATNTITVAGDGSLVEFHDGSSVELIAGNTIRFLPGFHAYEGSFVHAWITTDGSFCDGSEGSIVQNPQSEKSVDLNSNQKIDPIDNTKELKVYPNPNNGNFTIELANFENRVDVYIFNSLGLKVYQLEATDQTNYTVNLPEINRGIYFIKVIDGRSQFTKKIIVK